MSELSPVKKWLTSSHQMTQKLRFILDRSQNCKPIEKW